jgi:hypothetical protein
MDIALARADDADVLRRYGAILDRIRDGDRVLVNVQANLQCATVSHG